LSFKKQCLYEDFFFCSPVDLSSHIHGRRKVPAKACCFVL
jgi:hypothetical protein